MHDAHADFLTDELGLDFGVSLILLIRCHGFENASFRGVLIGILCLLLSSFCLDLALFLFRGLLEFFEILLEFVIDLFLFVLELLIASVFLNLSLLLLFLFDVHLFDLLLSLFLFLSSLFLFLNLGFLGLLDVVSFRLEGIGLSLRSCLFLSNFLGRLNGDDWLYGFKVGVGGINHSCVSGDLLGSQFRAQVSEDVECFVSLYLALGDGLILSCLGIDLL